LNAEFHNTPDKPDGLNHGDFRHGGTGRDRRQEARENVGRAISILPLSRSIETGFQTVNLLDCSVNGIAIMSQLSMAVGEQFMVRLDIGRIIFIVYRARNCSESDGKCRIGAEIMGIIGGTGDDFNQILKILRNDVSSG
jgi:hypothetical protein